MKASELISTLNHLPADTDPDIVMGEAWLPERLIGTQLEGDMLFLHFDNAPEDGQGDEEASLIGNFTNGIRHYILHSEKEVTKFR